MPSSGGASLRRRLLAGLVRASNLIIGCAGGVMLGYGGYLAKTFGRDSITVWGSLIGLGALELLFGAGVLFCGYRSLCALRLYGLVLGGLTIVEAAIALMFWVR